MKYAIPKPRLLNVFLLKPRPFKPHLRKPRLLNFCPLKYPIHKLRLLYLKPRLFKPRLLKPRLPRCPPAPRSSSAL